MAYINLRSVPSIPNLFSIFIVKGCWDLSEDFFDSPEMILWFLFFILLMCCITFMDLHMLYHPFFPGMNPAWSWWVMCWCILLLVYGWGVLHLCSSNILVYSYLFIASLSSLSIRSMLCLLESVHKNSFCFYFAE